MSHWNYRVVHRVYPAPGWGDFGDNESWSIHEAFYDDKNRVWGISENACAVDVYGYDSRGKGLPALRTELKWFALALTKPILEYDQIPEPGALNPADDPPLKRSKRSKKGRKR